MAAGGDGEEFGEALEDAEEGCHVFIFLLNNKCVQAGWLFEIFRSGAEPRSSTLFESHSSTKSLQPFDSLSK